MQSARLSIRIGWHGGEVAMTRRSAVTWGGLMMAENSVMPYMPRLEMVNVPPENSSGFSLFALACAAHAAAWPGRFHIQEQGQKDTASSRDGHTDGRPAYTFQNWWFQGITDLSIKVFSK